MTRSRLLLKRLEKKRLLLETELGAASSCVHRPGGSFLRIRPNRGGWGTSRATGRRVRFLMTQPWTQWHLKPDSLLDFPCFMSPERTTTHRNHSHFFRNFKLVSLDFRCLQLESFFTDIKKYSEYCLLCAEGERHATYGFSTRGDGWMTGWVSRAPREKKYLSVKMNQKGAGRLCEHGSRRAEACSEGRQREMTTRGRIS